MRRPSAGVLATILFVLVLSAPLASAQGWVDSYLERAAKLEGKEAAKALGDLLNRAATKTKTGLAMERKVAGAVEEFLEESARTVSAAELQKRIATVFWEMDPKWSGAFVSAHALAREVLLSATRSGSFESVYAASQVLVKYARGRDRGLSAKMMADYGAGFAALVGSKPDKKKLADGIARLDRALATCVEQGWYEMATTIGTELAVAHLAGGHPAKAGDALERAARANIDAYPDRDVLQKWDVAVKKRLPDAPAEVLEVMKKATASLQRGGAAAGAAGGVGGRGANANEDPTTELGRAWRRMKKTAPILTVKRDATIFDVRLAYTKQGDVKLPQKAGARSEKIGNLHVAFHGRSVALLEATLKMPEVGIRGGSSVRYRFCAWTLLAKGEVWSVGKDGAVRVRAR